MTASPSQRELDTDSKQRYRSWHSPLSSLLLLACQITLTAVILANAHGTAFFLIATVPIGNLIASCLGITLTQQPEKGDTHRAITLIAFISHALVFIASALVIGYMLFFGFN